MARPNLVRSSIYFVRSSLLGIIAFALLLPVVAGAQDAQSSSPDDEELKTIDAIVVTARKREESIQDIPIAITAFGAEDLKQQQIEDVSDLQLNMPNVSYTKTNFTGAGNFSIRGVQSITVARSGDPATGVHVNSVPMQGARIFETEFFDVERVEVLRGPQGTLFGRNSSAGVLNMITKAPGSELGGYVTGELGNFDHYRMEGGLTIPINENHGLRLAGYWLDRDGFTKNLTTDNKIDDRELWSVRATLAGNFGEDTSYKVMVSWFEEDDHRSRMTKQACTRDDAPFPFGLGCDGAGGDAINYEGTLAYQLGVVLGSFGVGFLNPAAPNGNLYGFADNPRSRRQVRSQFDPNYDAYELLTSAEISHQIGDYILILTGGYRSSHVNSQTDYFWATPTFPFGDGPRHFDFPDSKRSFAGTYDSEFVFDQSEAWSNMKSAEFRVQSDYDGPLNFTAGGSWFSFESDGDYYVWAASLEQFWDDPVASAFVFNCPGSLGPGPAPTGVTCHDTQPESSYFLNQGTYTLHAIALFGEAYYDVTDTIRLTGGVRWLEDNKRTRERGGNLFICSDKNGVASNNPAYLGKGCLLDGWIVQEDKWDKWIGRIGIEWQAAEDALLYVTWSTGFKGGGFNPPVASTTTRLFDPTYQPEELTAWELGLKSTWLDGTLVANAGFFFYDYEGMQVSKIQNRTGINENIDVEIMGVEFESVWYATENLRFDLSVSWIDSEIQDAQIFDPSDPTAGIPPTGPGEGPVAIKDPAFNGSNSVVPPNVTVADCLQFFGGPFVDGTCVGPGGAPNLIVGFDRDISGNELPHSPEWSIAVGVQYTLENVWSEWSATFGANYYWQDDMWGRYFNETRDKIDSWEQVNAQVRFDSPDGRWELTLFVDNLTDSDDITGHYLTDETSANFTNLFILEPRTMGAKLTYNFGGEDN